MVERLSADGAISVVLDVDSAVEKKGTRVVRESLDVVQGLMLESTCKHSLGWTSCTVVPW